MVRDRAARKVKGSNCCIIQKDFMCTVSVAGLFSFLQVMVLGHKVGTRHQLCFVSIFATQHQHPLHAVKTLT